MGDSKGEFMQVRALVIGINDYVSCDNLKYAVPDAASVSKSLREFCHCEDPILITDNSEPKFTPLNSNIVANIKILSQTANENDNIMFYFAGHGKEIDGEPVLLPADFRDEVGLASAIRIEEIKNELDASKAKFKLLILDSCHSGAVKGRAESGQMGNSMFKAVDNAPNGFAIISSCGLNQVSFEDEELKHGVFTHYLLEGVKGQADANGDRVVTVHELYDYVTPRVKDRVYQREKTLQIPHMRANFSGVYAISEFPKSSPIKESTETFGTELFDNIFLETESLKMEWLEYDSGGMKPDFEDELDGVVKSVMLSLRKQYGLKGLKGDATEVVFKDGEVFQTTDIDERRNEARFSVRLHFKYHKESWSRIDNLMLEIDDLKNTWEKVEFTSPTCFDLNKVEKLCDSRGYEITDISASNPKKIAFETDFFYGSGNDVSVVVDDYSEVSIKSTHPEGYLREHFYTIINPKKLSELLGDMI